MNTAVIFGASPNVPGGYRMGGAPGQALPVSSPNIEYASGNPLNAASWLGGGGQLVKTSSASPNFTSNASITQSYAIYPWADKTHEYIQEGMLVFVSKHTDNKYRLYNMVPVFKLNIEMQKAWIQLENDALVSGGERARFLTFLRNNGETILEEYHAAKMQGLQDAYTGIKDLADMYRLAMQPEYRHLTKLSVLAAWNFGGCVVSKGESTGAFSYMDRHENTDMVYVVGCIVGERARACNIWGSRSAAHPGARCFLVLRRNERGHLHWVAWAGSDREYPPRSVTNYEFGGRDHRGHVMCIGMCTESLEREPSQAQIETAMGLKYGSVQQAYENHGTLGHVQIQIGI